MIVKHKLRHAYKMARLLDTQFKLGPFSFGLDPLIGLFPGIGDFIPLVLSGYLILIAAKEDLSQAVIVKMIFYAVADFLIGIVPVFGDLADFFYKSYSLNYRVLEKELLKKYGEEAIVEEGEVVPSVPNE